MQPRDDEYYGRLVVICEHCLTVEEQQALAGEVEAVARTAAEFVRYVPDINHRDYWLLTDLRGSDVKKAESVASTR